MFLGRSDTHGIPAAQSPRDVVFAWYQRAAAVNIADSTNTAIPWDTKKIDTHSMLNNAIGSSQTFIIPETGIYLICASHRYAASTAHDAADNIRLFVSIQNENGTASISDTPINNIVVEVNSVNASYGSGGCLMMPLEARTRLQIVTRQESGATVALNAVAVDNYVMICKLFGLHGSIFNSDPSLLSSQS